MENQVEEVKSKVDIVNIIGERIELKKAGRNYKAICPFHGEKSPSFMVSPELQIFKCFGCAEGGDAFSFLEKYEGMDFGEALKYLADRVGVKLKSFNKGATSEKERLMEINSQALRFYNYLLTDHPIGKKALEYLLKERGLKLPIIKEFQLGYSPDNPALLEKFLVGKKKFNNRDIETAGIAYPRGGRMMDRFAGRVIFPLFDHRGNPIGFAGRVLPWVKTEMGKYINSPETPLYHKSNVLYGLNVTRSFIKKKGVAIVVEGELDTISSYQAGIKNVVAIKGSSLTEEQVKLLSRFANKFILALDSDIAGDKASRRGIDVATGAGVEVKVAKISEGKDPDDAARNDLEGYKKTLIESKNIWDFLIDSTFNRFKGETGEGKAKISKEIVPILSEISDKIVQSYYLGVVAQKLGVAIEAVSAEIEKVAGKVTPQAKVAEAQPKKEKDRRTLLEERFLTLAFQSDPKILLDPDILKIIVTPLNSKILEEYAKYSKEKKVFNPSNFASVLPGELFNGFAELVLRDTAQIIDDPDQTQQELDLVEKELKILTIREELNSLTVSIRELEEKGERIQLLKAQNKFNKLALSLSKLKSDEHAGVIFEE